MRKSHGVNLYGLDQWPAEYLQVIEGSLDTEQWMAGEGIYVSTMRMIGDGTLSLYHPGDQVTVAFGENVSKTYTVLAVVNLPRAFATPLSLDMGLEFVLSSEEFLRNIGSEDRLPMWTIFNVDDEHLIATENWLKNYTVHTDSSLDYYSKVTLRQEYQSLINMYRMVGGTLCAIPLTAVTGLIPLICYHKLAQKTVVERLRIAE